MYRIGKRFRFEAAHRLDGLPAEHKCAQVHGHSYSVEVIAVSDDDLVGPGFVTDFADFAPLGAYLAETFDHRMLNDVISVPPTSENLARLLHDWCVTNLALASGVRVAAVRVSETDTTFAEYAPAWP